MALSPEWVRRYLERLAISEREPPTAAFLTRLHQAHVERIPWQTVDVFRGHPEPIDAARAVALVASGRGGYCFHVNTAFLMLLKELGYTAHAHWAGVVRRGAAGAAPPNGQHMALTVQLTGGRWIVDVGLGDMPHAPIPLTWGRWPQGELTYEVRPALAAPGGWRLQQDPRASYAGVEVDPRSLPDLRAFAGPHRYLSQDPASPWVNRLVLKKRDGRGVTSLRGLVLSQLPAEGAVSRTVDNRPEWFDVLGDVFGEPLAHVGDRGRRALWSRVLSAHDHWMRGGRDVESR